MQEGEGGGEGEEKEEKGGNCPVIVPEVEGGGKHGGWGASGWRKRGNSCFFQGDSLNLLKVTFPKFFLPILFGCME